MLNKEAFLVFTVYNSTNKIAIPRSAIKSILERNEKVALGDTYDERVKNAAEGKTVANNFTRIFLEKEYDFHGNGWIEVNQSFDEVFDAVSPHLGVHEY